jgi:protocatechuate 3,4-dioxygenase beta subunit
VLTIGPDGPRDGREIVVTLRPTATLTGRLLAAAGKPASGIVRVELLRSAGSFIRGMHASGAKLDADGRFRCEGIPAGGPYKVTASDGSAYGFRSNMVPTAFKSFDLAKDMTVEPGQAVDFGTVDVTTTEKVAEQAPAAKAKVADMPITGRVVDLEGRPVAGVSIRVDYARGPKSGDLAPLIASLRKGDPDENVYRHVDERIELPKAIRLEATSDADGRFRLEGIGGERLVSLSFRGDAIAFETIEVMTRRSEPIATKGFHSQYGPGTETVYGADFTYTARPTRPVVGVVRDATSKEPLEGVSVESYRFAGSSFVETRRLKTRSDAQGKFRLVGLPKGRGNMLIALPNDDQPYFMREVSVADPPEIDPVTVEVELHRGLWITGKVTDKETGEPVKEARLHYLPFLENKFVQVLPEFDSNGNVNGPQTRYKTGADGTFKLVGMPGRAIVGVDSGFGKPYRSGVGADAIEGMDERGNFKTYHNPIWPGRSWPLSMKEINPAEGTESISLDLQLDPGLSVSIRVVDPEGKPVVGAKLRSSGLDSRSRAKADGEFELSSFGPDEEKNVIIRDEGRKLGKVVRVRARANASGPVIVTLAPLARIKGRTVDADGRALPGSKVRPDLLPGGDFGLSLGKVVSDADGRFEVADVPTGCDYTMFSEAGTMSKDYRQAWVNAKVKPGETTDVGDIRFDKN